MRSRRSRRLSIRPFAGKKSAPPPSSLAGPSKRRALLVRGALLLALFVAACGTRGDGASSTEAVGAVSEAIGLQQWAAGHPYNKGDLVLYNGQLYQAIASSTGAPPSSSPAAWQLFDPAKGAPVRPVTRASSPRPSLAYKIGRITTGSSGAITEFDLPVNSFPDGIASGPDGALWFCEQQGIGRITTAGAYSELAIPLMNPSPSDLTFTSDGALWFTAPGGGERVGRFAR